MSRNTAALVTDISKHTFFKLRCMIKDIQKLLINKTVSRNDATLVMNKGVFEDQRWFHRMKSQDGSKVKKYSSRWWWWRRPKATFFGVCCQYSVKQQKKIKFCVNCVIVLGSTRMRWLNVFCWACCCGSCSPLYSGHSKEKTKKTLISRERSLPNVSWPDITWTL